MPILGTAMLIAGLASLGLPGTSGFVAEILVFLGTFQAWPWLTALAAFGVVLTAGYILWMIQRTLFGPPQERFEGVGDAKRWQYVPIAVLIIAIFVMGVYPSIISDVFTSAVGPIADSVERVGLAALR